MSVKEPNNRNHASESDPGEESTHSEEFEPLTQNFSGALAAEEAAEAAGELQTEPGESTRASLFTHLYKFVVAGVISAVVDYGLTMLVQHAMGQSYALAKAIGFIFGTLTAYMINRRWTFEAEASTKKFVQTMALYLLMFAVQWGLAVTINHLLVAGGMGTVWAGTIAYVIGQGVATAVNFVVQRWFIFA